MGQNKKKPIKKTGKKESNSFMSTLSRILFKMV
jgi:hypothetical protein